MIKIILPILLLFPVLGFAENPLNFEYTLKCAFSKSCKAERVEWAYHELQTQFVKTNFSYEQWLAMAVDESYEVYDRIQIANMNLKNYNRELSQFIQNYKFVLNHVDDFIDQSQEQRLNVVYTMARLAGPDHIEFKELILKKLPAIELGPIQNLKALLTELHQLVTDQHSRVEKDLMVQTSSEGFTFKFDHLTETEQGFVGLSSAYTISEVGIYIVSNPVVLSEVQPLLATSVTKKVVDLETYMLLKQIEIELMNGLKGNSSEGVEPKNSEPSSI